MRKSSINSINSILQLPSDQRAMIVGRTGSGKSTLARAILLPLRYVVVIDSKGEFELPNALVIEDPGKLSRLSKRQEAPVIFRPSGEYATYQTYNDVLGWCFARTNCTVYVDEVFDCMRLNQAAPNLKRILKQGRSKGVRAITSTQRPRSIPIDLLSESERYYMFELLLNDDRKRMSEVMGPGVMNPLPEKYDFWYYDVDSGLSGHPYRLAKG